ncbi:MAG: glycosyltransferase family 4 protein [Acidobacteriia bacterium]|nr:glycosyltransferase family 4 protein [Terriglobia bacterium]
MRLAVATPFLDRRHGTERALAELLERLVRDYRCTVYLYAQRVTDCSPALLGPLSGDAPRVVWRRVPSLPGPHLLRFAAWFVLNTLLRKWDALVRGLRFDLVFSPGINCPDAQVVLVHAVFHRLAALQHSQPLLRALPLSAWPAILHRGLYYRFIRFLERRIYANPAVTLAAVSRRTARQLEEFFTRREVPVVWNGVDTAVFHPAARHSRRLSARQRWNFREDETVFLLIGNDWKNKGLPTLLQAAALCSDLPLRLLIVGEEDPARFAAALASCNLQQRVSFSSPVADVVDLYAAADAYAGPSLEDSFNLPALEAMACGLPIILSTSAGLSDALHDGVDALLLQNAQDPAELAALLRKLLQNPALRERLGTQAAATAHGLSWEEHARRIHALLETRLAASRTLS